MKIYAKLKLLTFMTILLSAIVFAGCEDDDDRYEEELNRKVDQLEKEVESLREKDDAKEKTSVSDSSNTDTEKPSISESSNNDTIDSLTNAVNEVTEKADSVVPADNTDEKRTQFFELKDELNTVDHRLDAFDDYIEELYKNGEISYDDYISKERMLEELEDKLDASEDKLELNFGIDD